ncbi:MAG: phosphoribosylformylglycinamidine synthase subunit PurQ [Rhodospirillales bacterium]|nr:phosphoribosylformylglycinamidine synthase subunit PurQ [Rhodospirillales bacterium]
MKTAVIVFPGSNCDRDAQVALKASFGGEPVMVWHGDADMPAVDMIVVPGGFSYGDYLRSGAMAATSPIMREVVKRANAGVPVLGICNGFQILTESGLLPGALMRNAGLKFVCRDVHLRIERNDTMFPSRYTQNTAIRIPIAHHDGNYFADADTLAMLKGENRIAFRYCDGNGNLSDDANPNGSIDHIAGIYNEKLNVLGMMPHPERLMDPALGGTDGTALFEGLVEALAA